MYYHLLRAVHSQERSNQAPTTVNSSGAVATQDLRLWSASYEDVFGAAPNNETALFRFIRGWSDINPTGPDYTVYYFTLTVCGRLRHLFWTVLRHSQRANQPRPLLSRQRVILPN